MTTFEELFNQSVLAVIAPEASLGFPSQNDDFVSWQDWLSRLEVESTDRKLAFFCKVHTSLTSQLTAMLTLSLQTRT